MIIPNKYKYIIKKVVDNLDIKPLNMPRPIIKGSWNNKPGFEVPPTKPELDKIISNKL